jgi:hypothetical protein
VDADQHPLEHFNHSENGGSSYVPLPLYNINNATYSKEQASMKTVISFWVPRREGITSSAEWVIIFQEALCFMIFVKIKRMCVVEELLWSLMLPTI